jgi:hypothetical protein
MGFIIIAMYFFPLYFIRNGSISINRPLPMIDDALRKALHDQLALPKYRAGKALGWGRRATDAAHESGRLPVIDGPKPTVPTAWLRKQLHLEDHS